MSSESDFEEIAYSDLDSVAGEGEQGKNGEPKVLLENLPAEDLISHAGQQRAQANGPSCSSSFLSVEKMGRLTIQEVAFIAERAPPSSRSMAGNVDGDDSSWSIVEKNGTPGDDEKSIFSDFKGLSLHGIQLCCEHCSFLNPEGFTICDICGLALNANPCLDIDAQIAKNLQLKEEEEAFNNLIRKENKRKSMHELPLLSQSQILTDDIMSAVESHKKTGVSTIPSPPLTVLASRFIDRVREIGSRVMLAYHFSENQEWRMTQIRQDGLGPHAKTSHDIGTAFQCFGNKNAEQGNSFESKEDRPNEELEDDRKGWIIAYVPTSAIIRYPVKASTFCGWADVNVLQESRESLPLVCFDASQRSTDSVQSLLNVLRQVVADFFQPESPSAELTTGSPSKKAKLSSDHSKGQGQKMPPLVRSVTIREGKANQEVLSAIDKDILCLDWGAILDKTEDTNDDNAVNNVGDTLQKITVSERHASGNSLDVCMTGAKSKASTGKSSPCAAVVFAADSNSKKVAHAPNSLPVPETLEKKENEREETVGQSVD